MSSLFDFSREIGKLNREKQYHEALAYFKEYKTQFSESDIGNNEYIISDILSCLRHSDFFDYGFQFLNIYGIQINEDASERILSAYGWLLYSKYKSDNTQDNDHETHQTNHFEDEEFESEERFHYQKSDLIMKIEELLPLLDRHKSQYIDTLKSFLFNIVLKCEKKKGAPNWQLINDYCNKFQPNYLGTKCSVIQITRKGRKVDMELASDKENWYAYKTKALMKLGEWQECYELSSQALDSIDVFHYSNDVWFARRIALSKKNLGNSSDTIVELEKILKKKREWFIQKELADIYFEENEIDKAFKYAVEALNNFGPLEFKVDLLFLFGKILIERKEKELAFQHFSLSKLIREAEDWKVPQKVFDELQQFAGEECQLNSIDKLKSVLKKYWNSLKTQSTAGKSSDSMKGIIKTILNDNERGKNGFLSSGDNDYYFTSSINFHLTPNIKINSKVLFELLPPQDGKKQSARIKRLLD